MGQIVFNNQKPKLCKLQAIRPGGRHVNDDVALNEVWLVDTTEAAKSATGTGEYDAYIIGDGVKKAGQLPLHYNTPRSLSELEEDNNHRTVSDEQISRWNEAAAGEGGTLIESSDDITVVNDLEQNINRLEFTNKQYSSSAHSGLGKVYVKKSLQTVHTAITETLYDSVTADYLRRDIYDNVWSKTHDSAYKELAEDTDNTDAKAAANTAYNTAYNNAINNGKTVEEATALGNAAYVIAYRTAMDSTEEKDTQIETSATSIADNTFEETFSSAVRELYPQVIHTRKKYISGIIQNNGNERFINITPSSRMSISFFRIDAEAGSKYRIFATKSDTAVGTDWLSRFWMVTETPHEGATTARLIKAYKEDNKNFVGEIIQEAALIEAEEDCTIWINYIHYSEHMEPCKIERIYETQTTIEVNTPPRFTEENTEYIIKYDYDLCGKVLELPMNTTLKFDGGSISNGYINGRNSSISAFPTDTIFHSITLTGTWKNKDFYAKWFDAAGDGITDDTAVLQSMLDIAEGINNKVNLIWTGYKFRTTSCLYLKSNTSIIGGSIIADFDNPLDWIMQTRVYYSSAKIDTSLPPRYSYLASWGEFDGQYDSINHIVNSSIDNLTLTGLICKHMVVSEGEDETSEKVWDGTYCPIYGGLKINAGSVPTQNVTINDVGIGIARGACLQTHDIYLTVGAKFIAYAANAVNTSVVSNSYLNAWANVVEPNPRTVKYTPYYLEYQGFNSMPAGHSMQPYIEGNGGTNDIDDDELERPKFCSVKLNYAGLLFNSTVTDTGAEVGFAVCNSSVSINYPYFEGVTKCYIYARLSRVTVDMPEVTTNPHAEYDLIGSEAAFVLSNCENRLDCRGGLSGDTDKYHFDVYSRASVLNNKGNQYPDDDRFCFLSSGDSNNIDITSVSGTSLIAVLNKYYKFNSAVNTLTVTLPAMASSASIKGLCISFTTGNAPNITFTSADNKTISYFDGYPDTWDMNSEYEINCMYNGTKWVIAAALID